MMNQKSYQKLVAAHAPASPVLKNCLNAFWTGGLICTHIQVTNSTIESRQ